MSARMPAAPAGFVACRVIGPNKLTTHLVQLDHEGSNGGRPTMCGLTRFGDNPDLPSWGMGDSGVSGPGVDQVKCEKCYALAEAPADVLGLSEARMREEVRSAVNSVMEVYTAYWHGGRSSMPIECDEALVLLYAAKAWLGDLVPPLGERAPA